jgi:hypothetical protein
MPLNWTCERAAAGIRGSAQASPERSSGSSSTCSQRHWLTSRRPMPARLRGTAARARAHASTSSGRGAGAGRGRREDRAHRSRRAKICHDGPAKAGGRGSISSSRPSSCPVRRGGLGRQLAPLPGGRGCSSTPPNGRLGQARWVTRPAGAVEDVAREGGAAGVSVPCTSGWRRCRSLPPSSRRTTSSGVMPAARAGRRHRRTRAAAGPRRPIRHRTTGTGGQGQRLVKQLWRRPASYAPLRAAPGGQRDRVHAAPGWASRGVPSRWSARRRSRPRLRPGDPTEVRAVDRWRSGPAPRSGGGRRWSRSRAASARRRGWSNDTWRSVSTASRQVIGHPVT